MTFTLKLMFSSHHNKSTILLLPKLHKCVHHRLLRLFQMLPAEGVICKMVYSKWLVYTKSLTDIKAGSPEAIQDNCFGITPAFYDAMNSFYSCCHRGVNQIICCSSEVTVRGYIVPDCIVQHNL